MNILEYVKASLRIKTVDVTIDTYLSELIDSAKSDLCRTSDISSEVFIGEDINPLLKQAIAMYVGFNWTSDMNKASKYKELYDDLKAKISMSSYFSEDD